MFIDLDSRFGICLFHNTLYFIHLMRIQVLMVNIIFWDNIYFSIK